jgi:lysophospholipase L1-like esterase
VHGLACLFDVSAERWWLWGCWGQVDVLNRGCGGYNSRWGLKLLEQVLQQLKDQKRRVVLMTLWFGANDAALPGRSA